ncbi:glycosyltransferase [uncultured Massilia sp.]|uniref:glycosyltransferase family 4 protein n=1 Tax=uncultured Massilia sp. TaxID=169973 RepID=UPI0025D06C43|nr:glycosyltransferase [uncultured Massilia sp.]
MAHVVHIISGLKVGGAEMAMLRLIASSIGGSFQHSVVSLTPGGGMIERFAAAGIEVIQLDFKNRFIRDFFRLISLLRAHPPQVVQTWMYHADLLGGIAARLAGIRNVIWGIRTTDVTAGGSSKNAILRTVCARMSRIVPRVIVCAAEASLKSHASIGYAADRMTVIPNGFDFARLRANAEQREALRRECGFDDDAIVVGTLGRFNPAKDPENFVRAAGIIADSERNARFLMVGRDMMSVNTELVGWIARTGHADRFVLLGERSDVAICLSAMDVFCLTSRTEGFPNVLAEAMAMRLPCVTTDVGDAAVLLGGLGEVVPRENSEVLAEAVLRMTKSPESERRHLGEQASGRVNAEFSMKRMRERFEVIYNRLINK